MRANLSAQAKYLHLRKGIHITFKDFLLVVPQMAVKGRQLLQDSNEGENTVDLTLAIKSTAM